MNVTLRNLKTFCHNEMFIGELLALLGKTEFDDTEVSIDYILKNIGIVEAVRALSVVDAVGGTGLAAKTYMFELINQLKPLMTDVRSLKAFEFAEKYKEEKLNKAQLDEFSAVVSDAWDALAEVFEASNEQFTEAVKAAYLAYYAAAYVCSIAWFYYHTQPERILAGHPVSR